MMLTPQLTHGLLFVMVGPGGAGKNALMNAVMARQSQLSQLATATTRPIRANEQEGREHLFVTVERFQEMIANGELLEHQEVTPGRFYGIPRQSVDNHIDNGQHLIADIDIYGAKILRETYPDDTVLIFVTVPGETLAEQVAVLRERMVGRREEHDTAQNDKRVTQRLERAETLELPFATACDFVIVNDDLDHAIAELENIVTQKIAERATQETANEPS